MGQNIRTPAMGERNCEHAAACRGERAHRPARDAPRRSAPREARIRARRRTSASRATRAPRGPSQCRGPARRRALRQLATGGMERRSAAVNYMARLSGGQSTLSRTFAARLESAGQAVCGAEQWQRRSLNQSVQTEARHSARPPPPPQVRAYARGVLTCRRRQRAWMARHLPPMLISPIIPP